MQEKIDDYTKKGILMNAPELESQEALDAHNARMKPLLTSAALISHYLTKELVNYTAKEIRDSNIMFYNENKEASILYNTLTNDITSTKEMVDNAKIKELIAKINKAKVHQDGFAPYINSE